MWANREYRSKVADVLDLLAAIVEAEARGEPAQALALKAQAILATIPAAIMPLKPP